MVNVNDLSDGLWIAAFDSELHVEDCAVDTPKSGFLQIKSQQIGFSTIRLIDQHSKLPFVLLRFDKSGLLNSG